MNNMESFTQGGDAQKQVTNFLDAHPEYKDKNFSREEVGFVTQRVAEEIVTGTKSPEELQDFTGRAFDARLAVRGAGAETAVIDNGEVVGVAGSDEAAKGMMFGARNGEK